MKKNNLKNLRSLENFKAELEETHTLIHALEGQMGATEIFLKVTKAKERPEYENFRKYLEINEGQLKKIYELGFIAQFANFECFMFEVLKELFKKYPSSFSSEKIIKFADIKDFQKMRDIKDYFMDSLAIEKSYEIETWVNYLSQRFGISVFKKKGELARFKALNSLRNIMLHSGSKTNSKFRKELRNFVKSPIPIGEALNLDRRKYFGILYVTFKKIISEIEKS